MPPHCDTLDGPVVLAAKKAIEDVHVLHALPWVPKESEQEVCDAFETVMHAREKGEDACKIADQWFYETVVRLHRMGEGAPYTGLKPAGLDPGPAVRLAEEAVESGDIDELKDFFEDMMKQELSALLDRVLATAAAAADPLDTDAMRKHIHAKLSFIHLADELYRLLTHQKQIDRIREAEQVAKNRLEQSYSRRHPATAEALAHRHS